MARRNGYTDYTIPMRLLRTAMTAAKKENRTLSREDLVHYGVEKVLDAGLFKQYADEFKSYIVSNALNMSDGDEKAAGTDPVTGSAIRTPAPKPIAQPLPPKQVAAEKAAAEVVARARLADLAPVLFMRLPTPFKHTNGHHKTLGELTGREGRKLVGSLARFFKGVPDGKRLCDVKSEAQLRELWQKA